MRVIERCRPEVCQPSWTSSNPWHCPARSEHGVPVSYLLVCKGTCYVGKFKEVRHIYLRTVIEDLGRELGKWVDHYNCEGARQSYRNRGCKRREMLIKRKKKGAKVKLKDRDKK